MTGSTTAGATHILVFPFPAQGHMLPLLDFTHHIASQAPDLTITILVTPKNLSLLTPLLSAHPSIHTLLLPFPPHPAIPDGVENVKDMVPGSFRFMIPTMTGLREPLTQWFRDHPSPPTTIISDMFLGWTHFLSVDLGIRRITFSPSGAYAFALIKSLWHHMPKRTRPDPDGQNEVFSFPDIPNCPKYPWWKLSPLYRSYVEGDPDSEILRNSFVGNGASSGLIVNSFSELEAVYFDHLKKDSGHVWAVGPVGLQSDGPIGPTERGGSSSVSVDHISSWLDKCGDGKVVYVCFGSQVVLHNHQMDELAKGLERSGVHFVWSVKHPPIRSSHVDGDYGKVPIGFEDRVAEKGLVIRGWAPQVMILRHRAVGAFLTHCGWNSVLEAVVSGVPMLAWPMQADQYANATLLVDHLGVGTRVCEGNQTIPDSAELARAFAESLGENRVERRRVGELREAAIRATGESGSSSKDLESLVAYLKETTF